MRAIVIYATCEGQTERIAQRIAAKMTERGLPTDIFDVTQNDVVGLAVESYQAVVLGSSLHYAEHDPRIAWCIGEHRDYLSRIPSAFFSVSLGIISQHYRDRIEARFLADEFLRDQGFSPSRIAFFAGALCYSKYGWIKKHLMHWIADKSGSETEMDRDYDYTDWQAVEDFANEFADFVHSCRQPEPSPQPRFSHPERQLEYAVDGPPSQMSRCQ